MIPPKKFQEKYLHVDFLRQAFDADMTHILNYFFAMSYALGELKFNNDVLPQSSNGIGNTGTLYDAYTSMDKEFDKIQHNINEMASSIVNTFTTSVGSFASKKNDKVSKLSKELFELVTSLDSVQQVMDGFTASHSEMIQKFAKSTNDLVRQPDNSGILKKLQLQFGKIVEARAKNEKARATMITTGKTSIIKYRQNLEEISQTFLQRENTFHDLFIWVSDSYQDLCTKLLESINNIRTAVDNVNFESDFKAFINDNSIFRQEVIGEDFEPFDTSGPAFEGTDTSFSIEISMDYPIGLANVIHDHRADGTNEISCKAGKNILILEEPTYPWVYVMNPRTRVKGFIPSSCISKIGKKFGVIIRDFNGADASMQVGEYVAITDENKVSYFIENTFCVKTTIEKNYVGIIYI
ncbi:Variant SH3 domain containing protein [Histomonas meleagridis]|uniref:Variant SH3 domain containing protein n=1 Tax=Histomonas meleagridis TaxID=135588 RepID=UPI0035595F0A|nr:Variant SH3 domain containing protein [Histomonas meleagridis]KAH0805868.1 Variant SH3 domain containing protein [Histomonas meleagridis]